MKTKGLISKIFISTFVMCLVGLPASAQFGKLNKLKNVLKKNKVEKKIESVSKSSTANNDFVPSGKFSRTCTEIDNPETFYSSDINAQEHADWNKQTPTGKLQEHVAFLMAQQVTYLNEGDWDNVGKDFQVHSQPMWLVYKELRDRGEDVVWLEKRLGDLRQMQRQHLYPGIHVYDRNGYTTAYQTGDYDWKEQKITKKDYYEILKYYIEMAKREKSDAMKYVSTSQAIFWRGDGAMNPSSFIKVPLYADDADWIEAEKELTVLCKETGISGLTSFSQIEEYRKKLEMKALKEQMARNTATLIPKSSVNDPQAVKMATQAFNERMNGKATVAKVFVRTGWQETTNSLGVTISRAKYITIIAKYSDGMYRLHQCRFVSTTSNNGKSWSNSMFSVDSIEGNREGYPINWGK